jgi:hypothetical protein
MVKVICRHPECHDKCVMDLLDVKTRAIYCEINSDISYRDTLWYYDAKTQTVKKKCYPDGYDAEW